MGVEKLIQYKELLCRSSSIKFFGVDGFNNQELCKLVDLAIDSLKKPQNAFDTETEFSESDVDSLMTEDSMPPIR